MDKKSMILEFIIDELIEDDDIEISTSTSLFKDNILDSLNLLSLISYFEQNFTIKVKPSDVNYDNLDTIDAMDAYLSRQSK